MTKTRAKHSDLVTKSSSQIIFVINTHSHNQVYIQRASFSRCGPSYIRENALRKRRPGSFRKDQKLDNKQNLIMYIYLWYDHKGFIIIKITICVHPYN